MTFTSNLCHDVSLSVSLKLKRIDTMPCTVQCHDIVTPFGRYGCAINHAPTNRWPGLGCLPKRTERSVTICETPVINLKVLERLKL